MKNLFKFIFFLIVSLFTRKKRFIILNPNLNVFGFNKVFIYDKFDKNFFSYLIRNNFDYITIQEIYFYECYKIDNLEIYKKIFHDIDEKNLLIIDCGSNIGCSTNFFLNSYKNAKVISIEADEENFLSLKKNVLNENAFLINSAISNENFYYQVQDNKDNRAKKILIADQNNSKKTITVNELLNDKRNENLHPFLIKIDIEGHEKDLFNSNTEWFDKFDIIIIELHDWMMPGKSVSKGYLNSIVKSMNNNKRDTIISGENLISIKYK